MIQTVHVKTFFFLEIKKKQDKNYSKFLTCSI